MLQIGWSSKVISMEGPVAITGQMHQRISKGILDHNTLTACVMSDGKDVTILVSADLVSASDGIICEIREAVHKRSSEIPVEKILLSATHAHTSPRYMRNLSYDKAPAEGVELSNPEIYRVFLVNQAADAIVEAYESRKDGSFSYGYGYAVVAHHRRPVYFDDLRLRPGKKCPTSLAVDKHAQMYGNTDDMMFSGYEGPVDSIVNFLFTFDANGKLNGAIINVPCPSQNSEHESLLTADYWTQVRTLIREKYGDIYILSQCASAGDMSPRTLHYKRAEDRKYALKYADYHIPEVKREKEIYNRCEIAERIMNAFDEVYAWASKEKITEAQVTHHVKVFQLDAWKITEEQYRHACEEYENYKQVPFVQTEDPYEDYKVNTKHSSVLSRYENIMERYKNNQDYVEVECHIIQIGDIAICSNPFELYIIYQHRIQARSPYVQTFVVQLAASIDEAGYLCTAPAAENMGYSANIYSCNVSPEGGNCLVEETLKELEAIKNESV